MLISPEKYADLKERIDCLEAMEAALKIGEVEMATKFGELATYYAERIKRDDYTALDEKWKIYHKLQ